MSRSGPRAGALIEESAPGGAARRSSQHHHSAQRRPRPLRGPSRASSTRRGFACGVLVFARGDGGSALQGPRSKKPRFEGGALRPSDVSGSSRAGAWLGSVHGRLLRGLECLMPKQRRKPDDSLIFTKLKFSSKKEPRNRGSLSSHTTSLRVSASAGLSYHLGSMRQVTPLSRRVCSYSARMKGSSIQ